MRWPCAKVRVARTPSRPPRLGIVASAAGSTVSGLRARHTFAAATNGVVLLSHLGRLESPETLGQSSGTRVGWVTWGSKATFHEAFSPFTSSVCTRASARRRAAKREAFSDQHPPGKSMPVAASASTTSSKKVTVYACGFLRSGLEAQCAVHRKLLNHHLAPSIQIGVMSIAVLTRPLPGSWACDPGEWHTLHGRSGMTILVEYSSASKSQGYSGALTLRTSAMALVDIP